MDFPEKLQRAVNRGRQRNVKSKEEAKAQALNDDELKRLHSKFRLEISEYIETCVLKLVDHFPGFASEIVFGEKGWGAAVARDDLSLDRGRRSAKFSRFEITVRPHTSLHVLDIAAKGTIQNKEILQRQYFERIEDVEKEQFIERIDQWVLDYAELYASKA
ncbi:MAG: hypothetical protein VB878_20875 [Pirellulaceae bacterium]